MINIDRIQDEIDMVRNSTISNLVEMEELRNRYLSKDGVLPEIYKLISKIKGSKSTHYLNKMLELRHTIDDKIRDFNRLH